MRSTVPRACRAASRRLLSTAAAEYAVAPYRAMVHLTDAQRVKFAEDDVVLHEKMREHVPAALAHNGEEAFDQHLVGVQSVLRSWGAPEHLTHAALFHSIYGTEGFQGYCLPLSHRAEIAELIGPRAERLAWIFCMVDRYTVDQTVLPPSDAPANALANSGKPPSFYARTELGAFEMPLQSHAEWLDFLTLTLADWLEQVEGASSKAVPRPIGDGVLWRKGEAWGYRREAYAGMAQILAAHGVEAAPIMYNEVFGREPEWSREICQPKTPPMGEASLAAQEAMESAKWVF